MDSRALVSARSSVEPQTFLAPALARSLAREKSVFTSVDLSPRLTTAGCTVLATAAAVGGRTAIWEEAIALGMNRSGAMPEGINRWHLTSIIHHDLAAPGHPLLPNWPPTPAQRTHYHREPACAAQRCLCPMRVLIEKRARHRRAHQLPRSAQCQQCPHPLTMTPNQPAQWCGPLANKAAAQATVAVKMVGGQSKPFGPSGMSCKCCCLVPLFFVHFFLIPFTT